MGDTNKQYDGQLIAEYFYNLEIRRSARKEGAVSTVKKIDRKLEMLRLQLQPLKLPDDIPDDD